MTRLEKWQSLNWHTTFVALGQIPTELSELIKTVHNHTESSVGETPYGVAGLFRMAKEIIFDVNEEGQITLAPMTWVIDAKTLDYTLTNLIEGIFDTDEEVKPRLALALADEVPVVPNTDEVAPRLETIYADLLTSGFAEKSEGTSQRYVLTEHIRFDPEGGIKSDRLIIQPAEVSLLLKRLRDEKMQNAEIKAVPARIAAAMTELQALLESTERNEHDLQRCLTKYPILFGPDYRRVIPKHRLGSDYETDYALELIDGSVDVMEIEASTHRLYKRNGDPTVALVHAEQQVLNWLAWLDAHSPYARAKLPGVRRACGFVVVGSRATLNHADNERLRWRNMMYSGRLTVLTYEDLIDRCQVLHGLLLGRVRTDDEAAPDQGEASSATQPADS